MKTKKIICDSFKNSKTNLLNNLNYLDMKQNAFAQKSIMYGNENMQFQSEPNKTNYGKKVKHIIISMMLLLATLLLYVNMFAQSASSSNNKPVIGVLNIDVKGVGMQPDQMGNLVRLELEKIDTFDVIDRYDAVYLIEKNNINISNCYGKICLVEKGKILNADKMIGGSVEAFNEIIVITLKLIDVKTGIAEKTQVIEFLYLPNEIQSMIRITIRQMMGLKNDPEFIQKLTKKFDYENLTNNPSKDALKLNGPRIGVVIYTGDNARYIMEKKSVGGFGGMYPLMFQFGYQFEKQYLNEGNWQALFEFIPLITGIDQGYVIPSLTVLHGLRSNVNGFEFAIGPTIGLSTVSTGYYEDNKWVSKRDANFNNEYVTFERIDPKGETTISTGFIIAIGKTFKSGKLNIPVNIWVRPDKNGWLTGASFGFNAKKKKAML